jgi:hypothetical protein
MKRFAYVARTSHDLDHVNRIAAPTFALADLRLGIGNKTSKFYIPEDAPPLKKADTGSDEFHFVPEQETIEIRYEIDDRAGLVTGAKLELFAVFDKKPLWTLDFEKFGKDWWSHGKHLIKWDGRLVKADAEQKGTDTDEGMEHDLTKIDPDKTINKDDFPEGYTTLEFTPYKFRLTLISKDWAAYGNPVWGWTYWQILLHSIELDLGPEETIPKVSAEMDDRNKKVRTQIDTDGKIPADGATRKIKLISNIYKTSSGEMGTNGGFGHYKKMWGDGPLIPILAKIRLKDSSDAEVKLDESAKGAVALGNAKFLWDWEDPEEDTSVAGDPKPVAYVKEAIKFKKDATDNSPKGDNCHKDRGGKRGASDKPIFPKQDGYDAKDNLEAGKFPFKVEKCKVRKWAATSKGWSKGNLKGKTGVVFQPSRIAGDDYTLVVYLANERTAKDKLRLDTKDEKPKAVDQIKKKSGKFQMWREIHVVKYVRKKNSINDFIAASMGGSRAHFDHAYVHMEDQGISKVELAVPNYNALAKARIDATGSALVGFAVDPAADHSSTSAVFLVRSRADFKAKVHEWFTTNNPTADPGDIDTWTDEWLTDNSCDTSVKYSGKLDGLLKQAGKALAGDLKQLDGVGDGITVLHFNYTCSIRQSFNGGGLVGSAIDVAGNSRNRCLFLLLDQDIETFVHEIGHHLFLAHFGPKPDSFDSRYHDSTDLKCMMSYNDPVNTFCGFCQLRMRGWDGDELKADGTKNG